MGAKFPVGQSAPLRVLSLEYNPICKQRYNLSSDSTKELKTCRSILQGANLYFVLSSVGVSDAQTGLQITGGRKGMGLGLK